MKPLTRIIVNTIYCPNLFLIFCSYIVADCSDYKQIRALPGSFMAPTLALPACVIVQLNAMWLAQLLGHCHRNPFIKPVLSEHCVYKFILLHYKLSMWVQASPQGHQVHTYSITGVLLSIPYSQVSYKWMLIVSRVRNGLPSNITVNHSLSQFLLHVKTFKYVAFVTSCLAAHAQTHTTHYKC